MVRLGLQLTLRSGREALVRALMIGAAVAISVTVLLSVFADYHAYQAVSSRACWECTNGRARSRRGQRLGAVELQREHLHDRFIEVLDVAPLGAEAPMLPGYPSFPSPANTMPRRRWPAS